VSLVGLLIICGTLFDTKTKTASAQLSIAADTVRKIKNDPSKISAPAKVI